MISENDKIGLRKRPYVFTLNGVKTLLTIFKAEKDQQITKIILEAFESKNSQENINNSLYLRENDIINMIYNIRDKKVILDEEISATK